MLKDIPLFKNSSDESMKRLAAAMGTCSVFKGDILFNKGTKGSVMYFVMKGTIRLGLQSKRGDELVLAIISEGDFFGEEVILNGKTYSTDAIALEPAELLVVDSREFLNFLNNEKEAMLVVMQSLLQRLHNTVESLADACFLNVSGRLAKQLVALANEHGRRRGRDIHIDMPLNQKELAGMIGATRESINKGLRMLKEKGLVSKREQCICIHDLERLRQRAR